MIKKNNINKTIIISTIIAGLSGCSSDSTSTLGAGTTTVSNATLNGSWKAACEIITTDLSIDAIITFNSGDANVIITTYSDETCDIVTMLETGTVTYTLGSNVTVDGTIDGITAATQIDILNTTVGSVDFGNENYDLVAIKDLTKLYFGDTDGANDGSTPALRATQLEDTFFTKQ